VTILQRVYVTSDEMKRSKEWKEGDSLEEDGCGLGNPKQEWKCMHTVKGVYN
jgi:hypothetical protein